MVASLKSLIGRRLRFNDGRRCRIFDIHLHSGTWEVKQLAVKMSGHPWPVRLIDTTCLNAGDFLSTPVNLSLCGRDVAHAKKIVDNPPLDWLAAYADYNFSVFATHWSPGETFPEGIRLMAPENGPHLHSLRHLLRYLIRTDGGSTVGKVIDFSVDEATWQISTLVAQIAAQDGARQVALDICNVASVDFAHRVLALKLERNAAMAAPSFPVEKLDGGRTIAASLFTLLRRETPAMASVSPSRYPQGACLVNLLRAQENFPVCFG